MKLKRLFLLIVLLLVVGTLNSMAQNIPSSVIEINNVRGSVLGTGQAYSHQFGNDFTWEVPKGSGKSPLFQYSLWVGAKDINEQIHLAAHRYNQEGRDYWMGPLSIEGASISSWVEEGYEHIWNLTRVQIDDFISHHGQPGYEIPQDILTWPAHGPEGYAYNLAPFVDVNGDGRYDPNDGDYPDILGDQCLFFIFNDAYGNHTETGGAKLKMEVQAMVYAFDEPDNDFLNNTVFFHYDLINRSTYEYTGTYVGVWNDWDIGNGVDDYVGCNVRLGACYGYNSSDDDEIYGDNPPVQLCTILAGPFLDPDGLDNSAYSGDCEGYSNYYHKNFDNGIVDDERFGLSRFMVQSNASDAMGDPTTAEEYYRTFRGVWPDGNYVMYGGNGYPGMEGTVGPRCNFMFPNDTDPCNFGTNGVLPNGGYNVNDQYWTEQEAGNEPGDRRGLAIMGPFTYKPGRSHPLDFALTTVWKSDTQSALERIEDAVEAVRRKYEDDTPWSVMEQPVKMNGFLNVYPNPSTGAVTIEGTGRLTVVNTLGQQVLVCNIEGQMTTNLPAGLYFARLENEKGSCVSKFLVK